MFHSDIDECQSLDDVCMNGRCLNTLGDYMCRCNTGYTLSTDKHMCLGKPKNRRAFSVVYLCCAWINLPFRPRK